MRRFWAAAALLALAGYVFADSLLAEDDAKIDRMSVDSMQVFKSETLAWKDEPILPKGAQSAVLVGDPNKAGVFIARLKFPSNYKIPPHTHPFAEVVIVLSGKLGNGMGEKFDAQTGELLNAGASFSLPANHAHYVWTTNEETIVELIATGPWGITYTDPTEDPRKKAD